MFPEHPRTRFLRELALFFADAATIGVQAMRRRLHPPPPRHPGAFKTRRPGASTPHWNLCCAVLREELRPYGSKVRLARYLGLPKQRISDFLAGRRRMPDAETLLQMLHWVATKRAGRDLAL